MNPQTIWRIPLADRSKQAYRSSLLGAVVSRFSLRLRRSLQRGSDVFVAGEEVFYAVAVTGEWGGPVTTIHSPVECGKHRLSFRRELPVRLQIRLRRVSNPAIACLTAGLR